MTTTTPKANRATGCPICAGDGRVLYGNSVWPCPRCRWDEFAARADRDAASDNLTDSTDRLIEHLQAENARLLRIERAARALQRNIAEFGSLEYAQEHLEEFDAALELRS